jgi:hypothetical protein
MRVRRGLAVSLAAAAAAVVGCGDPPSQEEQQDAKGLLRSAVDAVDREGKAGFSASFSLLMVPRDARGESARLRADVRGRYAVGGRLELNGSWLLFGRDFNGRLLSDPQVGTFAYDNESLQWYGDEARPTGDPDENSTPEDALRRLVANGLLVGYPATLADRRAFGDPLDRLVKRVIELYGERVVELSVDDGDPVEGQATTRVGLEPNPDEIVRIVLRRGTQGPGIEDALRRILDELETELLLGKEDHLPRKLHVGLSLEDLEIPELADFERVEFDASLELFDWGKGFAISPPSRFKPLYRLSAFAPD